MTRFAPLVRWLKWLYVAVVAVTLVHLLVDTGDLDIDWHHWSRSGGTYLFCLGWAAMVVVLGKAWAVGLQQLSGVRLGFRTWLPAQTSAWAGRYLPGKIGLFAGKLALLKRSDVPLNALTLSVLYEQLAFVVAGALIAVLSPVPFSSWGPFVERVAALLGQPLVIVLMAIAGLFAAWFVARWMRPRFPAFVAHRWWQTIIVFALHGGAHVVVGIGFHALVVELATGPGVPGVWFSVGALAAAHVAGALAIFAPAGLGVREVVLAAALSPFMPFHAAIVLATIARALTLIVDALLFVAGRLSARWLAPEGAHAPSS